MVFSLVSNEVAEYSMLLLMGMSNLDVRDPKQIYAAVEETVEKLGPRLYISVANAGVTQVKPLLECTPE